MNVPMEQLAWILDRYKAVTFTVELFEGKPVVVVDIPQNIMDVVTKPNTQPVMMTVVASTPELALSSAYAITHDNNTQGMEMHVFNFEEEGLPKYDA